MGAPEADIVDVTPNDAHRAFLKDLAAAITDAHRRHTNLNNLEVFAIVAQLLGCQTVAIAEAKLVTADEAVRLLNANIAEGIRQAPAGKSAKAVH
ncbi:hypothetical protein [Ferrovibrio sp.]|uniref:hypothetical protein n=1 Tax=Ferrovibrio sp. TaxID=1917215 RepID=UPI003D126B82